MRQSLLAGNVENVELLKRQFEELDDRVVRTGSTARPDRAPGASLLTGKRSLTSVVGRRRGTRLPASS